jgi:hypothetical protein
MSGVTVLQTGTPFNITEPTDRSLSGAGSDRPDVVGTGQLQFFDPRNTDATLGGPNRAFNGTGGGSATAATNPFFRRVGSGTSLALAVDDSVVSVATCSTDLATSFSTLR